MDSIVILDKWPDLGDRRRRRREGLVKVVVKILRFIFSMEKVMPDKSSSSYSCAGS